MEYYNSKDDYFLFEKIWAEVDNISKTINNDKTTNDTGATKCDCDNSSDTTQDLSEVSGTIICLNCGIVVEARVISGEAEWSNYNNDDMTNGGANMNRCGVAADKLTPSYSTFTEIRGNSKISLLNRYISIDYKDRVLYHLKCKVRNVLFLNNIPENISQETLLLYKKVTENKDVYRGKNRTALLAACVYHVANSRNLGLPSHKITESFDIDNKTFSKFSKILSEYFITDSKDSNTVIPQTCSTLVERNCIILKFPFKIISLCKKIASAIEKMDLFPNTFSVGVVSGIILFVKEETGLDVSRKDISMSCSISEATTIKFYKKIIENKNIIFNYIKNNN